ITGYRAKKSLVFSRENVIKFLTEALDEEDGYCYGAGRKGELCRLTRDNIEDEVSYIRIFLN
ncbi:hypothetical protein BDFB_011311, partial [Asbolus verrucosus]